MFFLKKLLSAFLLPLPLGLALVAAGLVLLQRGRASRGQRFCWVGLSLILVCGYRPVSATFMRLLEAPYRVVRSEGMPAPDAIVILGGGFQPEPALPANFELGPVTTVRLVEGIRLWRLFPEARFVLSGGGGLAEALAETASWLGVAREKMDLENASLDTADEARLLRESLAGKRFLLVTSGSHMSRSLALFRAEGLSPTPAPADFLGGVEGFEPQSLWPSSGALSVADRALHEWLGSLWAGLQGRR